MPSPTCISRSSRRAGIDVKSEYQRLNKTISLSASSFFNELTVRICVCCFLLLLFAGCRGSSAKPSEPQEEDAPTAVEHLQKAKTILAGINNREDFDDSRLTQARSELRAIHAGEAEYRQSQALLSVIDQHAQSRFSPILWDSLKDIDNRRGAFAAELRNQLVTIDNQIQVTVTGFGQTELTISSPKLTDVTSKKIETILTDTDIAKRMGFILVVIRNNEKIPVFTGNGKIERAVIQASLNI